MDDLNIPLSAELREFLDEQVKRGGYSSAAEYMRALIEQDRLFQERRLKAEEELENKLIAGLHSKPLKLTDADWDAMLDEALKRAQNKNAA